MARLVPTPKTPVVKQDDGSVTMLVYGSRTFRLHAVHKGLMDSTGYKARFGFSDKPGNPLLASADSEDGSIVFSPAMDPDHPLVQIGTLIAVTITDEDMAAVTAKKAGGYEDLVLEDPSGAEDAIVVGDWILYAPVTP